MNRTHSKGVNNFVRTALLLTHPVEIHYKYTIPNKIQLIPESRMK